MSVKFLKKSVKYLEKCGQPYITLYIIKTCHLIKNKISDPIIKQEESKLVLGSHYWNSTT